MLPKRLFIQGIISPMRAGLPRRWDIFCRVVDNFGDAAVSWRLAQQLAAEQGAEVRLWIDRLEALRALCPEVVPGRAKQRVAGVAIHRWTAGSDFGAPAEIAVDAFGCGLPDSYLAAMSPRSLWIVLEYLSAEPWVGAHHGLPSPHPRLPLQRYFFFPGFTPGTGGVLKEASLESRRNVFDRDPAQRAVFWRSMGFAPPGADALVASLFGYDSPAVEGLLQAWADGDREVVAALPPGPLRARTCAFLGIPDPEDGIALVRGRMEVRFLPFVAQPRYDELLWSCDWNFVRGEDSLVRGLWASRPLVWHAYPQAADAHLAKLEALLDWYCSGLDDAGSDALRALWRGWNAASATSPESITIAWRAVQAYPEGLASQARSCAHRLAVPGELAANLAHFCAERLK